jgi:K+-transporting ATPase ATPase A chain
MSYLTQMAGLAWHNFTSAAVGIAAAVALARGLTRRPTADGGRGIGNFWVDLIRAILYVLLPISIVIGLVLVALGVIQNLSPYLEVTTLELTRPLEYGGQWIERRRWLQADVFLDWQHVLRETSPLTNFLSIWMIFAIRLGSPTFGRMAAIRSRAGRSSPHGDLFLVGVGVAYRFERRAIRS